MHPSVHALHTHAGEFSLLPPHVGTETVKKGGRADTCCPGPYVGPTTGTAVASGRRVTGPDRPACLLLAFMVSMHALRARACCCRRWRLLVVCCRMPDCRGRRIARTTGSGRHISKSLPVRAACMPVPAGRSCLPSSPCWFTGERGRAPGTSTALPMHGSDQGIQHTLNILVGRLLRAIVCVLLDLLLVDNYISCQLLSRRVDSRSCIRVKSYQTITEPCVVLSASGKLFKFGTVIKLYILPLSQIKICIRELIDSYNICYLNIDKKIQS